MDNRDWLCPNISHSKPSSDFVIGKKAQTLEEKGEELLERPPEDPIQQIRAAKPQKYSVEAFLKEDAAADSLHPSPNPIIQYCRNNPILLLGVGSAVSAVIVGLLLVAGIGVSVGSFGAGTPIGVVLFGLSAMALGLSVGCLFGAIAGDAYVTKMMKPKESEREKLLKLEEIIKNDQKISQEDKRELLSLVAGKRPNKKLREKLETEYAALSHGSEEGGLAWGDFEVLERVCLSGKPAEKSAKIRAELGLLLNSKESYRKIYHQAVNHAYVYGDKSIESIVERGRKNKLTDAQIWKQIKLAEEKKKQKFPRAPLATPVESSPSLAPRDDLSKDLSVNVDSLLRDSAKLQNK